MITLSMVGAKKVFLSTVDKRAISISIMSMPGVAPAPHAFSAVEERVYEGNRKRIVMSTILAGIMLVAGVVVWTNLPLGSDPAVLEVQSMAFPELRSLICSLLFVFF